MIAAVLIDEHGNMLSEQVCVPTELVSRLDDSRFSCLRFVDPYGDTVFNCLQMAGLLGDLRILKGQPESGGREGTIRRIEELAEVCQNESHQYIKFIGD
jgi:hypothetical protein